ncbi:S-layer homology domain-containing protein [Desulforamulus ruminis]|uniref:S-layer domain-containing protein n=1 Tax=Desulforamulus ruminis (strain ATCC 23193 / DSM 2154 / NCIMB 8452 / DL) TaxID=696281 RepID=F6DV79_DESRL|nr:S-layer homology domain-containing protein [Desulforamulus ruminis]AEG59145.1 S-layer domain-containing protein [Desulforamulus ruminis DSM 2154]
MRKISKLLMVLLSICLLSTLFAGSVWADSGKKNKGNQGMRGYQGKSTVFVDVNNHWAKNDIEKLQFKGIMKGYENQQFMPERSVTKNEAIAIIMRVVNHEEISFNKVDAFKNIFPSWMGLAPVQAYDAGIIADWELVNWNGNQPATRIEVAMWLSRASEDKDVSLEEMLSYAKDVKQLSKDELVYAAVMYNKGIMKGSANGYLNPYKAISRGEFAVMISRFMNSEGLDDQDPDDEDSSTVVIKQLVPANKAKIDVDTREFKIRFSEELTLAEGKDREDLLEAVRILRYEKGAWANTNLDFTIVFSENDDDLVIKLDRDEKLAGNTKYCITLADNMLETVADDSDDAKTFTAIAKGEWTFATGENELALEKATASSKNTVVLQFNETLQKGEDFSSSGAGIHILKGHKELDIDAAGISKNKLTVTLDADDSLEDGEDYKVWIGEGVIDYFAMNEDDALTFEYQE